MADDFEVSIFLTDISAPHSVLTRQKLFRPKAAAKPTGGTRERPVDVTDDGAVPLLRQESSDEDKVDLAQIPLEGAVRPHAAAADDTVSVSSGGSDRKAAAEGGATDDDDKKKLGLTTSYEGFNIYGRILCLIVKRTGAEPQAARQASGAGGQAMMEEWIASTQEPGVLA